MNTDEKSSIKIDINKVIGRVHPYIFGHFIEHFPHQIYGGIYDENSAFSDSIGFRLDVQEALKNIRPTLLRWPGGNYTSGYHWAWGAGPKRERKPRKNPAWNEMESHHFGTTEFIEHSRRIGAEPLICVGVGRSKDSPTPEEVAAWVRYCNANKGSEMDLRLSAGYAQPLNVKWWGLGNECWGFWQIGYYKSGADYGLDILKYMKLMKEVDNSLHFVAVGVDPTYNRKWNKELLSNNEVVNTIELLSWHHYFQLGYSPEPISHEKATLDLKKVDLSLDKTIELIQKTCKRVGRKDHIKIAVDEWNEFGWEVKDIDKNDLPEQYDLAHALYTAGFLNILLRKANYIIMANYSPNVNTRGLIFADERGVLLRTSYYVYQIYHPCMDGYSVVSNVNCPYLENSKALALDAASIKMSDKIVYLFVVNRDSEADILSNIEIAGFIVKKSSCEILTADSLRSYNDFDHPNSVFPENFESDLKGEKFEFNFPKHSIIALKFEK